MSSRGNDSEVFIIYCTGGDTSPEQVGSRRSSQRRLGSQDCGRRRSRRSSSRCWSLVLSKVHLVSVTSMFCTIAARVLSKLFSYLGKNEKLGLSGRRNRDIGILMTSKLYKIQGKLFAFAPQVRCIENHGMPKNYQGRLISSITEQNFYDLTSNVKHHFAAVRLLEKLHGL